MTLVLGKKGTVPFVCAAILPLILDHIVTLVGQPEAYWKNFSYANEGSPAYVLLAYHPVAFLLWGILYGAVISVLLIRLPKKFTLALGILVYTGHSWGSASWIPGILAKIGLAASYYWYITIVYFAILSVILAFGIASMREIRKSEAALRIS